MRKSKSYNKEIGKPDESLGRKATGPLKWQPVAGNDVHCLFDSAFFMTIECSQSVHSIVEEFGCIVAILVMLGLFIFLNQSYIQKFIYEERLNQMDEITPQMFLNLEDVMGTKWDFLCERRWSIFMILPLKKRKRVK